VIQPVEDRVPHDPAMRWVVGDRAVVADIAALRTPAPARRRPLAQALAGCNASSDNL
jgi:hypothetical protein